MPGRPAYCKCPVCRVQTSDPRGVRFASASARVTHLAGQVAYPPALGGPPKPTPSDNPTAASPTGQHPSVSLSQPIETLSSRTTPLVSSPIPASPTPDESIDSRIFLSTLLDTNPAELTLPDDPCDTPLNVSMDDIIQSLNRLKLSEAKPDQGKSRDMAHPSDALPSSAASSQRYPSRRERNHLNQKCIDALDNILASITSAKADISSPSQTTLRNAEAAISKARKALSRLSRRTESVDKKRHFVINALQELETSVKAYRNTMPEVRDGPVEFDSTHHYAIPAEELAPAAQVAMFLGIVCSVVMGVSRRGGDLIMGLLSLLLTLVLVKRDGRMEPLDQRVINQIPTTITAALSRLKLEGQVTTYAACPSCHFLYKPQVDPNSKRPVYPDRCSNSPLPGIGPCNEPLLTTNNEDPTLNTPIRPFDYWHFADYLAGLLSQHEALMDKACDDCMVSLKDPPPAHARGFFDAQFIRGFRGPQPHKLFINRPGSEGRYLFALNVDFFNVEGNHFRGARTSCGLISMACLNLPLEIRHRPENIYLCIIPGPVEPRLTDINHYLRPLIDDMVASWEFGIRMSKTPTFPDGRNTCSAVAAVVCDLPAARKTAGLASHSSHYYCSVCSCCHLKTLGCTNYQDWKLRDCDQMRRAAEQWRDAESDTARVKMFQAHGVRWSELWRLSYWDPTRQLVVDPMHCLFINLAKYHSLDLLELSSAAATSQDVPQPAYQHDFLQPQGVESEIAAEDVKDVLRIHRLLFAPVEVEDEDEDRDIEQCFSALRKKLTDRRLVALRFVCDDLDLDVQPDPERRNPRYTMVEGPDGLQQQRWVLQKRDLALALVNWRRGKPLTSGSAKRFKIVTPEVLQHVKDVIRDTVTPSWLSSVPHNFGDAAAGSLKADEWRTMFTVYLPIALVGLWGNGHVHQSPMVAGKLRSALDHTMNLVSAIHIACLRTMTVDRANAYRHYIAAWLREVPILYPHVTLRTNSHMAFHIFEFLHLFGPVRSWWCFPFERLIGQLQRLPQNHSFGQLESTMLQSFTRAARLWRWLAREDCPAAIIECKRLFEKAYASRGNPDLSFDSREGCFPEVHRTEPSVRHDRAVPSDLRKLISINVKLHSQYKRFGVVYAQSSTHLGNSLVYFHPEGRTSDEVPGVIKYIVNSGDDVLFAVQRHLDTPANLPDPFERYPYVPAKLYRTALAELELVKIDWVVSHFARWTLTSEYVVVLSLSKD